MSAPPDRNRLQAALAEADLRVLLMVMFQITGLSAEAVSEQCAPYRLLLHTT